MRHHHAHLGAHPPDFVPAVLPRISCQPSSSTVPVGSPRSRHALGPVAASQVPLGGVTLWLSPTDALVRDEVEAFACDSINPRYSGSIQLSCEAVNGHRRMMLVADISGCTCNNPFSGSSGPGTCFDLTHCDTPWRGNRTTLQCDHDCTDVAGYEGANVEFACL